MSTAALGVRVGVCMLRPEKRLERALVQSTGGLRTLSSRQKAAWSLPDGDGHGSEWSRCINVAPQLIIANGEPIAGRPVRWLTYPRSITLECFQLISHIYNANRRDAIRING